MNSTLPKLRIGVVRGGPSSEYEVSLKTGSAVLKELGQHHCVHDVLVTRDGRWHHDGVEKSLEQIVRHLDVVFNAMHGEFGEDGKLQQLLDAHGVRYTGSGALGSAMAMNKAMAKQVAERHGIKTPLSARVTQGESIAARARELYHTFPHPAMVKPVGAGSSVGASKVQTMREMEHALRKALAYSPVALVEEFIVGREATCGVLDHFRDQAVYAFPTIEIIPPESSPFFGYDEKYGGGVAGAAGMAREICPGNFPHDVSTLIQDVSKKMHTQLGLRHYSRSDFMVSPRRGVYYLETNSLPGLTAESLFPKGAVAVGSSLGECLHHIVGLAMRGK